MKKIKKTLLITLSLLSLSGCATWNGVKKDSNDAWKATKKTTNKAWEATKEGASDAYDSTKKAIHNMTSDDDEKENN